MATRSALDDIFHTLLRLSGVPEDRIKHYSMHSWRIYLACALLAAGASHATIQALLRWRSEEALKLYARINDEVYAENLARASQAKVSSIRTSSIADIMQQRGLVEGQHHATFYDSWITNAARSTVTPDLASQTPRHTADDMVRDLLAAGGKLAALAEEDDADI